MARSNDEVVGAALRDFEEDCKSHDAWALKIDRWYRAWRGVVERQSEVKQSRSQFHPRYLLQVIETLTAGVVDPSPRWQVKPRPRMAKDATEIQSMLDGAKALEYLLAYQRDIDDFVGKQRAHRLQGMIAGLTVWKPYWNYAERQVTRRQTVEERDEYENVVSVRQDKIDTLEVDTDDPCVELVDMRDFIWHEAATSLEKAKRVTHRVWMTFEELKELEVAGVYKNVDQLKESRSFSEQLASRESDLFEQDRTKDMIEVLECWIEGGKRVVTIANRKVLLRDRPNPFHHGKYPFIGCGPVPDLFRIPGISIVEMVEELQQMLWKVQSQRHDNLELINNAIVLIREDLQDPYGNVWAPGEQWIVPDMEAVKVLEMNPLPAQVSLEAEALIKADIQNIPGASPALLGQSDQTEQTATEVSLLTNLAQRRLAAQKFEFTRADIAVGEQWIELNQQFLSEERYVAIVGDDGEEGWELIHPEKFRDYRYKIDLGQMDESLMRQERMAEAQARMQVAGAMVPMFAMVGMPLNPKAFMDDYLRASGVDQTDKYYASAPQPAAAAAGQGAPAQPGSTGAPTPEDMLAAGQTAPSAYDSTSPSNEASSSPVAALSRMFAATGGPVNQ